MHYSPVLFALASATSALAQLNGYSVANNRLLGRDAVSARQVSPGDISPDAEYCGTDSLDWWCEDPSTTCCFGTDIWQCVPITAEECCTTGYYCPSGSHCYLGLDNGVQYCVVPEEEDELASHPGDFHPSQTAVSAEAAQTGGAGSEEDDTSSSGGGSSSKDGKGGSSDSKSEGQMGSAMKVLIAIPAVAGLMVAIL